MLRDLRDAWSWIERLVRRVERVESGAFLENSSITSGRMRFIGGLLRIDSGGTLSIEGTLLVDGTTTVTGNFKVTGPWQLEGNGTITGNVTISGNVTSTGTFTQNGPWNLNGAGKIAGNVDLTGDLNVISGGEIKAGAVTITPAANGGTVRLGSSEIYGSDGGIMLNPGSGASIITSAAGVRIAFLPTISEASSGLPSGAVHVDALGYLRRVV